MIVSIDELFKDENFLSDLRNRKFVLVLGAGFSCGIKNQVRQEEIDSINEEIKKSGRDCFLEYSQCSTIPLAGRFIDISNKIFDKKIASNNYPKSANTWITKKFKLNDLDLKEFFRNLFQPDIEALKPLISVYKNIFNADWNNIYTLNFDTVIEELLKGIGKFDAKSIQSYQDKTSLPLRVDFRCLAHLHGVITDNIDKLVFGEQSYTNIRTSTQSIYDCLHGELEHGKKLFILGTRFDETVIDDKLFHDIIPEVCFFGLKDDVVEFDDKHFIQENPKARLIEITDTKDVLGYLEKYKSKIENIQIDGATVITKDFLTVIEEKGKLNDIVPESFYLAKQNDDIQWYGIIKKWDIERSIYQKIKEEVKISFEDEYRQTNITALIYGRGGSGKSTFLRRLAVDFANEDFAVLWLNNKEIESFYRNGLQQLNDYTHKKFLILIEDWYTIKDDEIALQIIKSLYSFSNIRIVVGDRTNESDVLQGNIYNPDENVLELTVKDNQGTIEKILDIVPEWKDTATKLLPEKNDYLSSLYLILWTLARTYQKNEESKPKNRIKAESLMDHFRNLIKSDLKAIETTYPGLAKMIYYWASVNVTGKIYISFDLFLMLADSFNGKKKIQSKRAFITKEIKPILDIYINKSEGIIRSAGHLPLLAFNHDILVEEGISKAKLKGWPVFDDSIKLMMFEEFINEDQVAIGVDSFSASNFLCYILYWIDQNNLPDIDRKKYISILYASGIRGSYLDFIFNKKIDYNDEDRNKFALNILDDFLLTMNTNIPITICYCLQQVKELYEGQRAAGKILSYPEFYKLPEQIVSRAMNISKETEDCKKAISTVLSFPEFYKLPSIIVTTAMNLSKDKEQRRKATNTILSVPDFFMLPKEIVTVAMNISKDKLKRQKAAQTILSYPVFYKLPYSIVTTAMNMTKDIAERKKAAIEILSLPEFNILPKEIVTTAMNILKDDALGKKAALIILSSPKFYEMQQDLVTTAMNISKDTLQCKEAANTILSFPKFYELQKEIVSTALHISKDDEIGKQAAITVLSFPDFLKLPNEIVTTAMRIYKDDEVGQVAANTILSNPEFYLLPNEIVTTAMYVSKDEDLVNSATHTVLSYNHIDKLSKTIVSAAMSISKDEVLKHEKAVYFLKDKDWRKENWNIVFQSLYCFRDEKRPPKYIEKIINTIIKENYDDNIVDKKKYFRYINVMRIPFFNIPSWKESNDINISNWEKRYRDLVTITLLSNFSHPLAIGGMCLGILYNWETEITKPIFNFGKEVHKGDHIKFALGHPTINQEAYEIAEEMNDRRLENPDIIPKYLINIIEKIVNERDYPEWNIKANDEFIID